MPRFIEVLPWILPPVLGAVIGYITNAVAIRMLFRPFKEWKILGLRVPFTPGIIPKQRHQLAESIGLMVSNELLTADILLSQTGSSEFKTRIQENISSVTSAFFSQSARRILTYFNAPDESQSGLLLKEVVQGFFMSESFQHAVEMITNSGLTYLTAFKVRDIFLDAESRERFIDKAFASVTSVNAEERTLQAVSSWIDKHTGKNTNIGQLISDDGVKRICRILDILYKPLLGFLVSWLRRKGVKEKLEEHGRYLLRDILDKLNIFQKLLVAATQYDRTLQEKMSGIVDDVLDELEHVGSEAETKNELIKAAEKEFRALRKTGFADIQKEMDIPLVDKSRSSIEDLFKFLRKESTKRKINTALQKLLSRFQDKTLEEILEKILSKENAAEYLSDLIRENVIFSEQKIADRILTFLSNLMKGHMDKSLQELLGINVKTRERLDGALTELAVNVINKRVPDILESFDVYNLIVSKIDGLNVEEVEGLLMRVIHKHLKWINVFGAILGFLIGMIQILTRIIV